MARIMMCRRNLKRNVNRINVFAHGSIDGSGKLRENFLHFVQCRQFFFRSTVVRRDFYRLV